MDQRIDSAQDDLDVTPSDSTNLSKGVSRAVYVGTGGNLAVILENSTSAKTYKNVPSGTLLQLHVLKVMNTNTTATDIIALY